MTPKNSLFLFLIATTLLACNRFKAENQVDKPMGALLTFENDLNFLQNFTEIDLLRSSSGSARVAISADLQGRVMTSSSQGAHGQSYGWINRSFFEANQKVDHMNPYGGEERFWLGPEGGQFSIFFRAGDEFTLDHWQTPPVIDSEPFKRTFKSDTKVSYQKQTNLTNYSRFTFELNIERSVELLSTTSIGESLEIDLKQVKVVGYRTTNKITNIGESDWNEKTGLLSIWLLGMFNPSDKTTIVIPFIAGDEQILGPIVKDDYFGKVPVDRLKIADSTLFFKGDGKYRGKIGLSPSRAKSILGSYDEQNKVLTIIKYKKPDHQRRYVNSSWEIQQYPYRGDVVNSYNDGPATPGAIAMGPFYELETSSPALALAAGASGSHIQETFHFEGLEEELNKIALELLEISLADIRSAF